MKKHGVFVVQDAETEPAYCEVFYNGKWEGNATSLGDANDMFAYAERQEMKKRG